MAYYAYKQVRDLLPQHIIDAQGPDYEGDANYDGDQWDAAADYIEELKQRIAELEKSNALLLEAATTGLEYAEEKLIEHDQAYRNHPATKAGRGIIVSDIAAIRTAIAEVKP